jgi:DNA-binding FadR family transcriptional regulator
LSDVPAESFRPVRVTDRLVEHLARRIVSGRLLPGSQVPSESELASHFGISKVGVRAAVGVLTTLGLVQVQQGKRTVVRAETEWAVLSPVVQQAMRSEFGAAHVLDQLYETRLILEPECARMAAERATASGIRELEDLLDQLRSVDQDKHDAGLFLEVDLAIHDAIGRLVQNPSLRAMTRDLLRSMLDNWADSQVITEDLPGLVEEHARIVAAIAARDGDAASAAMKTHILSAREVEVGRRRAAGHTDALPSNGPDGASPGSHVTPLPSMPPANTDGV